MLARVESIDSRYSLMLTSICDSCSTIDWEYICCQLASSRSMASMSSWMKSISFPSGLTERVSFCIESRSDSICFADDCRWPAVHSCHFPVGAGVRGKLLLRLEDLLHQVALLILRPAVDDTVPITTPPYTSTVAVGSSITIRFSPSSSNSSLLNTSILTLMSPSFCVSLGCRITSTFFSLRRGAPGRADGGRTLGGRRLVLGRITVSITTDGCRFMGGFPITFGSAAAVTVIDAVGPACSCRSLPSCPTGSPTVVAPLSCLLGPGDRSSPLNWFISDRALFSLAVRLFCFFSDERRLLLLLPGCDLPRFSCSSSPASSSVFPSCPSTTNDRGGLSPTLSFSESLRLRTSLDLPPFVTSDPFTSAPGPLSSTACCSSGMDEIRFSGFSFSFPLPPGAAAFSLFFLLSVVEATGTAFAPFGLPFAAFSGTFGPPFFSPSRSFAFAARSRFRSAPGPAVSFSLAFSLDFSLRPCGGAASTVGAACPLVTVGTGAAGGAPFGSGAFPLVVSKYRRTASALLSFCSRA
uniref:Uncharacterized protein n=1 Tax=Anopheles atroparvus TaxID=41427 RepID=A0A182IW46_ANOAO